MFRVVHLPFVVWGLYVVLMFLPAQTLAVEPVKIDHLNFKLGTFEFKAEGVEFHGLNVSPEALETLVHGSDRATQANALASLDASAIHIARLSMTQSLAGQTMTAQFSHVAILEIHAGIAQLVQTDQITIGTIDPQGETSTGSIGSLVFEEIDLSLVFEFGNAGKAANAKDFRLAYHLARLEAIALRGVKGLAVAIDKIETRDVRLIGSNESFSEFIADFNKPLKIKDSTEPIDLNEIARNFVGLLSAISTGGVDVDDLSVRDTRNPQYYFLLNRLRYSAAVNKTVSYHLDDLNLSIVNFKLKIEKISQANINMDTALKSLKTFFSKPNAQFYEIDPLILMPLVGKMEFTNLDFETILEGFERFKVGSFRLEVDTEQNVFPTLVDLYITKFTSPLSDRSAEPNVISLMGLGYPNIDMSGGLDVSVDTKTKDLTLKTFISAENIAAINVNAVLANVSLPTLINAPNNAPFILLGSSVKLLQVYVQNLGLAERLIDQQSIKTGRTSAEIRSSYATAVAASLQIYLGMSPNAKALTDSVIKFIGKPEKISIAATAINPNGVTISDAQNGSEPVEILDLFVFQLD